jgi:NADH-quinone oxidoreductase subunit M
MGIDGISMWLVVLTTFLTPLCVLISWKSIHERVKEFFILLLILETALIGVFTSLDLVPVLLLLGSDADSDGAADRHVRPRAQSLCRGKVFHVHHDRLGVHAGGDSVALCARPAALTLSPFAMQIASGRCRTSGRGAVAVPRILRRLRRQSPAVPVPHLAAGRARRSAHRGSVLLAGVLLKMGTYGMLRFNLGLFPEQARHNAPWIMTLALIGIIYGALVAWCSPT